jgi:hypothetical protein
LDWAAKEIAGSFLALALLRRVCTLLEDESLELKVLDTLHLLTKSR